MCMMSCLILSLSPKTLSISALELWNFFASARRYSSPPPLLNRSMFHIHTCGNSIIAHFPQLTLFFSVKTNNIKNVAKIRAKTVFCQGHVDYLSATNEESFSLPLERENWIIAINTATKYDFATASSFSPLSFSCSSPPRRTFTVWNT